MSQALFQGGENDLARENDGRRANPLSVPSLARVFANVIPRRRDKNGNPIPRRHVCLRPVITLDPKALSDVGEAFLRSPEEGKRHLPWLKAKNAVAADENVRRVREEMYARMEAANARADRQLEILAPKIEGAQAAESAARDAAVAALQGLPIAFRPDDPALDFAPSEPHTLEELAGIHGLPAPVLKPGWWEKIGYKLLSAVGGGFLFGIGFGLLTDKLELVSVAEEWPLILGFGALGIMIMTVVGGIFPPLGRSVGSWLYHRGVRVGWMSGVAFACVLTLLGALAYAIVRIESKVDQLGLFKGLASENSLQSVALDQSELLWVSLAITVPVVACYCVLGIAEGERTANLAYLRGLLASGRREIRESLPFAKAAAEHQKLRRAIASLRELESSKTELESQIRHELNLVELERLEDMEMDAAEHSHATEDFMLRLATTGRTDKARSRGLQGAPPTLFRRLLGFFQGVGRR